MNTALKTWERLGGIPIDRDECIEEPFEHFPVGTFREDIWQWFENNFGTRVYDLMFPRMTTTKEVGDVVTL